MKPTKLPSGSWRCQVYIGKDAAGKRHYTSVTNTDRFACIAEATKIAQHHHEVERDNSLMTLGEAIDSYIELKSNILSQATIRGYSSVRKNHLQPEMNMTLKSITNNAAQRAINREAGNCSPKTVKNIYGVLTAVMSQYTNRKLTVTLPQPEPFEGNVLSEQDLTKLIKVLQGEEVEIPILLAMFLGLRRSEILALEHSDYDPKNKTLSITKAKVPNKDNVYVIKTTKTVKSNRKISVPPYLASRLETRIEQDKPFCSVSPSHICTKLGKICVANDIPKIRLHDLRHQNASVMLALGVADKYAMERGGWSSNATMKNIYQHTMTTERMTVDQRINSYFEGLVSQSATQNATRKSQALENS